jgi:hypothetical protein
VALALYERVIETGEVRGNVPIARWTRANRGEPLIECGRLSEFLDESETLLPLVRESGDLYPELHVLLARLMALFELGRNVTAAATELNDALDRHGIDDVGDRAIAALGADDATALAGALERVAAAFPKEQAPPQRLVRAAASLGDADLVGRLTAGTPDVLPEDRHAIVSHAAIKAELAGRLDEAGALYAEAAACWEGFGNRLEHAYALLGRARVLERLGDPAFEQPLRDARARFERMEGHRGVAECDEIRERADSSARRAAAP